ncbi:sensor histidine kinase [Marinilabilia rubra]|uniref:Signal transduction histidine kinase internal region domain-containing protein n=1 Tax=Marinilabilia rubra TaxID=2162893 RepID=A0A2U2B6S7_9BACT|nr:histidine kinase [Marinilabilia rubra]PWD98778.1 hypothetical protein DDZ16_13650 [Marinilabilia rubra]
MKRTNSTWLFAMVISIPISLIIIAIQPIDFDELKFYVQSKIITDKADFPRVIYEDLNNDYFSEKVEFRKDPFSKKACLLIQSTTNQFKDQINLKGSIDEVNNTLLVGDLFKDAFKDAAVVTREKDSLFLILVDMNLDSTGYHIKDQQHEVFLDTIWENRYGEYDYLVDIKLRDTDKDGYNEVFVSLLAGFSVFPRRLYKFDITKGKLFRSNTDGACGHWNLTFSDLDKDGIEEAIGVMPSRWNISDTSKFLYHDKDAYLMAFDSKLKHFFKPIRFKGIYSSLQHQIIERKNQNLIGLLNNSRLKNIDNQTLFICNNKGQIIAQKGFKEKKNLIRYNLLASIKDSLLNVFDRATGEKISFSVNLKKIDKFKLPTSGRFSKIKLKLNPKGKLNTLFFNISKGEYYLEYNEAFHKIPEIPPFIANTSSCSVKENGPNQQWNDLVIYHDGTEHLIKIAPTGYSWAQYPFYTAICIILFSFVFLLLNYQRKQVEARYQEKEKLKELELRSVFSQLNPHFTFNVLNSVGASILMENKEIAYNQLIKLSNIIRFILVKAKAQSLMLKEEIEFVEQYLSIEKNRFGEKLEYTIELDESVDMKIEVPKMIIQVFVENSLKHGISSKLEGGSVKISISPKNNNPLITIEDDGIGRIKAKQNNTHSTGKGIRTITEYIELFNKQKNRNINFKIEDGSYSEGFGTRVLISL